MIALFAVLIGVLFACSGLSFKISALGGNHPMQNLPVLSFFGMLLFGGMGWAKGQTDSWIVVAAGVVFGITQYLPVRWFFYAMKLGPFSPMWCAFSLAFVPIIVFSGIVLGEPLSIWQYGSISATIGAIIVASLNGAPQENSHTARVSWRGRAIYGMLLVLILASNSILGIGLKFLSVWHFPGESLAVLEQSGNFVMAWTYATMLLCTAADLTLHRLWRFNRFAVFGSGLLLLGALGGYSLLLHIIQAPAVIVFALSNSTSILMVSLGASLLLKEKRTSAWYWSITFSLLAIVMNR